MTTNVDNDHNADSPAFLQRWSERKAQVKAQELQEQEKTEQEVSIITDEAADLPPQIIEDEEKQELTDADMPPLDTIDEKTDLSVFFSPKVSTELRRLALRKMFHLPVYNIRDGLNDYDDDYTKFEALGDIVTSDMKHMQEVEELRRQQKLAEAEKNKQVAEAAAQESDQLAEIEEDHETAAADSQPAETNTDTNTDTSDEETEEAEQPPVAPPIVSGSEPNEDDPDEKNPDEENPDKNNKASKA